MPELGVFQPLPMDVVNAVERQPAILREAQNHHRKILAERIELGLAERLQQSLADCAGRQEARGEPAVVLVPATVRAALARLVRHSVPSLSVLAYTEVPEDKRLKLVGTIS